MIHAYVDESGSTGPNLFDPIQPVFYTGTLISLFDFDKEYPDLLRRIAESTGRQSFHANELGVDIIRPHLPALQSIIKKRNLRFYLGRVVKRDLILAKFVDTLFDPHENRAAPWHCYWLLPMRFLLLIKLNAIADEGARSVFWSALMDDDETSAIAKLKSSIQLVLQQVPRLPDRRSREIIGGSLQWAFENPEAIGFFAETKQNRIPHYPNLVAFPEMLAAIERQSDYHKQTVFEIKHDRQSEVQNVLIDWHKMISDAGDGEIEIFGTRRKFRSVPDSTFVISRSCDSSGIQLVDLMLWLQRQVNERHLRCPVVSAFLCRAYRNAEFFDLSMEYTIKKCEEELGAAYAAPFGDADEERALSLLERIEANRREGMRSFAERKVAKL